MLHTPAQIFVKGGRGSYFFKKNILSENIFFAIDNQENTKKYAYCNLNFGVERIYEGDPRSNAN